MPSVSHRLLVVCREEIELICLFYHLLPTAKFTDTGSLIPPGYLGLRRVILPQRTRGSGWRRF